LQTDVIRESGKGGKLGTKKVKRKWWNTGIRVKLSEKKKYQQQKKGEGSSKKQKLVNQAGELNFAWGVTGHLQEGAHPYNESVLRKRNGGLGVDEAVRMGRLNGMSKRAKEYSSREREKNKKSKS